MHLFFLPEQPAAVLYNRTEGELAQGDDKNVHKSIGMFLRYLDVRICACRFDMYEAVLQRENKTAASVSMRADSLFSKETDRLIDDGITFASSYLSRQTPNSRKEACIKERGIVTSRV